MKKELKEKEERWMEKRGELERRIKKLESKN